MGDRKRDRLQQSVKFGIGGGPFLGEPKPVQQRGQAMYPFDPFYPKSIEIKQTPDMLFTVHPEQMQLVSI